MRTFASAAIVLLVLSACAVTIYDETTVQLHEPSFNASQMNSGGIAILPITAGRGQEGYRRPIGRYIKAYMDSLKPHTPCLGPDNAMTVIGNAGLSEEYASMLQSYRDTSILEKEVLTRLGEAVRCRYLLYVSLEDFSKSRQTSYGYFTGFHVIEDAAVTAFCQVWDTQEGRIVWEAFASAKSTKTSEFEIDQPYETYAAIAAKGLVIRLP